MSEILSEPEAVPVDPLQSIRDRAAKRKESGEVGGVREWFDIDYLLRVIDDVEYEYSVVQTYLLLDQDTSEPYLWYTKEKAQEWLKSCEASYASDRLEGKPVNFTSKIVKRRKAGPVEDI